jgi:hypothetical protein
VGKQKLVNDPFNVAEFIGKQMEGKRTGVKKEENKIIEEGAYRLEGSISTDIQDRLRDEEIESHKKTFQEQNLQLIKVEEEDKTELARRLKEKSEKKQRNKM